MLVIDITAVEQVVLNFNKTNTEIKKIVILIAKYVMSKKMGKVVVLVVKLGKKKLVKEEELVVKLVEEKQMVLVKMRKSDKITKRSKM